MSKRVFWIVLDSFGIGEAPDAAAFGDVGSNTLGSVCTYSGLCLPNLQKLGLFAIDGTPNDTENASPIGCYARMQELSRGKDTTIGHWEMAGVISPSPMPTFPNGFPKEVLDALRNAVGRDILCNKPYSGTAVIADYGAEHMRTGSLIVYTSADSVLQIAAHEEIVPLQELYEICRKARAIMTGPYAVGRIIARPFVGTPETGFTRTYNRHDFSVEPPRDTALDLIKNAGLDVIGIGKITDIFAGKGITETIRTQGNTEGIARTLEVAEREFNGLCYTNLVDFDMIYGHRRDIKGYAEALNEFDRCLPELMKKMGPEDYLVITADHGCDPGYTKTTDHTREFVPLLIWGADLKQGENLGTLMGFGAAGATVCEMLEVKPELQGESLLGKIICK